MKNRDFMDSAQILALEAQNKDKIILLMEGMFWKAYERSAFQICSTMEKFQTSKRAVKKLGGEEIISIGFPDVTEERRYPGVMSHQSCAGFGATQALMSPAPFRKSLLTLPRAIATTAMGR